MDMGDLRNFMEENEHLSDDVEVRLATQPTWPYEYTVGAPVVAEFAYYETEEYREIDDALSNSDDPEEQKELQAQLEKFAEEWEEKEPIVYFPERRQLSYLPGEVRNLLGW